MRKLCFGGSFNPIHHGHLLCAQAAAEAGRFDRVVLIPSSRPPHKVASDDIATAKQRAAMCRLAAEASEGFEVNELELDRTGPSYTIDTARLLKSAGCDPVHWLIGSDTLASLPSWHDLPGLLSEVDFVVVGRPGWTEGNLILPKILDGIRLTRVAAPLIQISATDIRRRIARSASIDFLTPPGVVDYIREHGLYRQGIAP